MANARPKNSRDWVKRHLSDPWVKKAQEDGYRSRAVYKLQEIDARGRYLRQGAVVVDLGSAPGGWSQLAAGKVGKSGLVVAIDLLPMEPIPGVVFIESDFSTEAGHASVVNALGERRADLVISDMSPNMTGIPLTDQARLFALGELALEFATTFLQPDGVFVVKVFQGAGFEPYVKLVRQHFAEVATRKPNASRDESREVYLVARHPRAGSGKAAGVA